MNKLVQVFMYLDQRGYSYYKTNWLIMVKLFLCLCIMPQTYMGTNMHLMMKQ